MIDSGVPGSPEEWPNGVLQRLRAFSQGDVIRTPPLFYFADPRRAIWSETQRYLADSDGPEVVLAEELSPPYGLITSQTCDIAEEDSPRPLKPWVQVAPIFALRGNSGYKKHLRKGAGPAIYIYLPNLPGEEFWVADLRIEVPVEKGWLAYQERLDGFGSEEAQSIVGQRVGWLRERFLDSGVPHRISGGA